MDQEACPTCSVEYVVFRDIENKRWRFLCRCEQSARCSKGRHPATHAKLNAEGGVERFACDDHGVPADERPATPSLPPLPPAPAPEPEPKPRRRPPPEAPKPRHDLLTLEGFKAAVEEDKLRGRCRQCRRERMLIDSVFRPVEGTPLYDMVCPHCGHDRHDFIH